MTASNVPSRALVSAVLVLMSSHAALAQTQPAPALPRGDVAGVLGWLNVNKSELGANDGWYNRSLYGALSAGWYWTEHLKTEVDTGASTKADFRAYQPLTINGRPAYRFSNHTFSTRKLAVSQQYQFFRNAWFHPHIAAGADLTWETATERVDPLFVYDEVLRQGRLVEAARAEGPETRLIVRPFAAVGFKAYMTPRSYVRTDLRLAIRGGADEVLWRFGVGVDF